MHRWAERVAPAAALLLCAAPLFVVTVNGWSSGVLFVGALVAILMLGWGRLPPAALTPADRRWQWVLIAVFIAPLATAAIAALLRGDGNMPQFDAPSRLLLAIPVLLLAVRLRLDAAARLSWVLPLSLAITLGWHVLAGQPQHWHPGRMTTSFADPLAFGYLSLAFALMCLVAIAPGDWGRSPWSVLLRLAGVLLGVYLSVRSNSRTGWMAVPIVLALCVYVHWWRTHKAASAAAVALVVLAAVGAYLLLPTMQQRVNLGFRELLDYSWSGVAPDTSVAMRITFARIAGDLFLLHPWSGIGDLAQVPAASAGSFPYASPDAVRLAFGAGFHNQVVSSTVRSGIGGLLASAALLLVPLLLCARRIDRTAGAHCRNALMGLAFFTTLLVASLSTEVVDLKYMASFHAVMTAVLCGATLARDRSARVQPTFSAS